jgi:hypothetical protein
MPLGLHGVNFTFLPKETLNFFLLDKLDIFVNCKWVDTRWQYTFTHK